MYFTTDRTITYVSSHLSLRPLRPKSVKNKDLMNPLLTAGRALFNENTLVNDTKWQRCSGIAAGMAQNQLELQKWTTIWTAS